MKGVLLAGGLGTRLFPITEVVNKHLLPVAGKPMIFWPLEKFAEAGIKDVLVVVGGKSTFDILKLLGNGHRWGLRLLYAFQEIEGGIADALRLAEPFAEGENLCVILGDNILEDSLVSYRKGFESRGGNSAMVLLKKVPDPENYGCPRMASSGSGTTDWHIVDIVEKPTPRHGCEPFAVIGVYFYDATAFDRIRKLKPSVRGELEVTDLNNDYARSNRLSHAFVSGWWGDAGASIETLEAVSNKLRSMKKVEEAVK